jgi:hypothetical protein
MTDSFACGQECDLSRDAVGGHKDHPNVIECFSTIGSIETISLFYLNGKRQCATTCILYPWPCSIEPYIKLSNEPSWKETRRFPMKHMIISAIAVVAVLTTATTMPLSYSPSTERQAASTVIGHCKNFRSLAGTEASELLPY